MRSASNTSMAHRVNRGFTLVEMLIAVLIAGILVAIAVPSFSGFVARQRIKTASFDLMSSLILARSEAIKRNATVSMSPTSGDWKNGWTISVGATTLAQQDALTGIGFVCRSGATTVSPCPAISYANNGRISGAAAPSIEISSSANGSDTRCVSLDLSGRPHSTAAGCS